MPFKEVRETVLVRTLSDVLVAMTDLFRKEMMLARAELGENIKAGVKSSVWMIVAGFLGFVVFLVLVEAAIFGVASLGLALQWSCLIVAAVLAAVAAGIYIYGRSMMPETLAPVRSMREMGDDISTIKEQLT
ncbi:MAG: phage holin family protein [Alphaproteobacteria bacterium]|nr:phage holin family protein [Alphaproteobacteria bacterium]